MKYNNKGAIAKPPYLYPLTPYTILTLKLSHALLPQRGRRIFIEFVFHAAFCGEDPHDDEQLKQHWALNSLCRVLPISVG